MQYACSTLFRLIPSPTYETKAAIYLKSRNVECLEKYCRFTVDGCCERGSDHAPTPPKCSPRMGSPDSGCQVDPKSLTRSTVPRSVLLTSSRSVWFRLPPSSKVDSAFTILMSETLIANKESSVPDGLNVVRKYHPAPPKSLTRNVENY
jgi:hypothetical protein